jgi:hypothetical protein
MASIFLSMVFEMSAKHWPTERACAFISGLDRNASRSHGVRRSADTVARLTRLWSQCRSLAEWVITRSGRRSPTS